MTIHQPKYGKTMTRYLLGTLTLLFCFNAQAAYPLVEMKTSQGTILLELYPDKAPKTVANFLTYVKSGFYKGTIFHRVVNRFVIQGGGYTPDFEPKATLPAIPNEASFALKNDAGTLAMARTSDPDSATSQFFINVERNLFLNHYKHEADYYGYAVFGKVVQGMDIVQKISDVPTMTAGPFASDVPVQSIVIEDISVVPQKAADQPAKNKPAGKHSKKRKENG